MHTAKPTGVAVNRARTSPTHAMVFCMRTAQHMQVTRSGGGGAFFLQGTGNASQTLPEPRMLHPLALTAEWGPQCKGFNGQGTRGSGPRCPLAKLQPAGPSKPVQIRGGVLGNRRKGPRCKISHDDVFPQGLAEGKGVVLYRDPLAGYLEPVQEPTGI